MSARLSRSFDDLLRKRLEGSRSEAAKQVLVASRSGRRLNDAILDVIEALPSRQTKELRAWVDDPAGLLADEIYDNVLAYVRTFNGTMMTITNPYYPGPHRARIEHARVGQLMPIASSDDHELLVEGDYIWVDEKEPTKTGFAFLIVVSRNLAVHLKPWTSSKIENAPKEMVAGLRKALES